MGGLLGSPGVASAKLTSPTPPTTPFVPEMQHLEPSPGPGGREGGRGCVA